METAFCEGFLCVSRETLQKCAFFFALPERGRDLRTRVSHPFRYRLAPFALFFLPFVTARSACLPSHRRLLAFCLKLALASGGRVGAACGSDLFYPSCLCRFCLRQLSARGSDNPVGIADSRRYCVACVSCGCVFLLYYAHLSVLARPSDNILSSGRLGFYAFALLYRFFCACFSQGLFFRACRRRRNLLHLCLLACVRSRASVQKARPGPASEARRRGVLLRFLVFLCD